MPLSGDGLGGERLAAALDPKEEQPPRWRQVEVARLFPESFLALSQPAFEFSETPDIVEVLFGVLKAQGRSALKGFAFGGDDPVDGGGVEPVREGDGTAQNAKRLGGGEPQGSLHAGFQEFGVLGGVDSGQRFSEEGVEFVGPGQGQRNPACFPAQFEGQIDPGPEENHALFSAREACE